MIKSLDVTNAGLSIKGQQLFSGLDFRVDSGMILVVTGPSGIGKSSLLSWLCGTLDKEFETEGEAHLFGNRIDLLPAEERRAAIFYQDDLLFPHLTVGGNLEIAIPDSVSKQERLRRIDEALGMCGLDGFARRDPLTLSGGQRSRVSFMRCLLNQPRLLLLDEPFANLDKDLRELLRHFMVKHCRRLKLPSILITHDEEDLRAIKKISPNTAHIQLDAFC